MKKILVPTDFSVYAGNALNCAVGLAKQTGAEIILLHICDLLDNAFKDKQNLVNEYNNVKLEALHNQLQKQKASVEENSTITTKLMDGDVTDTILLVSQEQNVDLIVMGTLGATGLKTMIFGTRTATVISKSTLPVIAIPFDYTWTTPRKILMAISDADEPIEIFNPVFTLVHLFGAEIRGLLFSDDKAGAVKMMEDSRNCNTVQEKIKKHFGTNIIMEHVSGSYFSDSIQKYIDKEKIDILVMVTHRKNFLHNLLNPGKTQHMAYQSTVPLLCLHSAKK